MKTLIITIFSLLLVSGIALAGVVVLPSQVDLAAANQGSAKTLNGTIDGLDPLQQLVVIRTEEQGQKLVRFLAVTDPALMKGLIKGDRVIIELDEHGMAKKILKASADLKDAPNPKN